MLVWILIVYDIFGIVLTTSSLDGSTVEFTDTPKITLGFIVDPTKTTEQSKRVTYISCNISLEWFYADFTEPFQVYKTIRQLDTLREDIDLIVLVDFDQHRMQWVSLVETKNKDIIKLKRRSEHLNKASLGALVSSLMNDTFTSFRHVTRSHAHCYVGYNISESQWETPYFPDTIIQTPPLILANLVVQQGWKSVIVIYDKESEHMTRLYLDCLSRRRILYAPFNIDGIKDFHLVLFEMYNRSVKRDQKIYITVTCGLECILRVLNLANKFDSRNTEFPTLLKQFSRWLILVYDYSPAVTMVIEKVAHDLDNVAVVSVPEFNPPQIEYIVKELKRTVVDMSILEQPQSKEIYLRTMAQLYTSGTMQVLTSLTTASSDVKSSDGIRLVKIVVHERQLQIKTIATLDQSALCTHYYIDSLFWTTTGRKFQTMGTADLNGTVQVQSPQLFPNTQYGYSNRLFKVATHSYSPYVTKRTDQNNKTEYGGIYIDLLVELSRVLNFTYEIMEPPDGHWGVAKGVVNGTEVWNGMVGMLQRREVDLVAAPLTIIPARDNVIDFSYPVSYEYTTVVVKKPDPNTVKWRTLINPFKVEVLVYIGASLPIVTVIVCLVEKFGPYYTGKKNDGIRKEAGGLHHLHDSFWYMYGALLCQGGVKLPNSFAGRTFLSSWWIFCIIIVGTYCGNLIAFLTVSKVIAPFDNLDEMMALKGTYKWGTPAGTVLETVFLTSRNPQLRRVGDAMLEFNKTDPGIFHEKFAFHEDRVKRGFYAMFVDTTTIEVMMLSACDLMTIKERLYPMKDAFAFQHNSPHTLVFSQQIMKSHEAGLFEIWRRKWWPKQNFCTDKAKFESKPITLMDVQSAFYICLIGIFLGIVAFVAENLVYKFRKKRSSLQSAHEDIISVDACRTNNSDVLY